jgi:glycosyltransferase involved in cell wall biosynthesis
MRILFVIPELIHRDPFGRVMFHLRRHAHRPLLRRLLIHRGFYSNTAFGGTLNIMRHCALVRSLGVDAALVTGRGVDTYGEFNIVQVPFVRWKDIRPDDVCVIPDFCTDLIDRLPGPVIAYLQIPTLVFANFDYMHPRVRLWTDSPFMVRRCEEVYPGKDIAIVPNVVDSKTFPFRPQSEREPGLLMAFPRKGPDYIRATQDHYQKLGGKYWRFELIDGIPLFELARRMQRPQAFLASADVEGCALPPQECMASGIVVVGKNARGANFAMEHKKTAMVADTPLAAAESLLELEDGALRQKIAENGHAFISRYFPEQEPAQHWRKVIAELRVS